MSTAYFASNPVGIDEIAAYIPRYFISLDALADARNVARDKVAVGLGARKMAVVPPWEDTVTLGTNAAKRLFDCGYVSPDDIGLLVVATETAIDHAKPVSIFLHDLLGLSPNCRTFEIKHACYSGTAGVMIAADWVRSKAARGRRALVVATDLARYDVGSSAEFTQGAGAVAMVVGEHPRLFDLDPMSGVYARNVYDFWRPLDRREAVVDGKFSLDCYLHSLEGAVTDYLRSRSSFSGSLAEHFAALLYHTPFPKMAHKAHQRLFRTEWVRTGGSGDADELSGAAQRSYEAKVEPWLAASRLIGNTYTASLYFCLAWIADIALRSGAPRTGVASGRPIGLFSYGSGSCAEFFSGRFVAGAGAVAAGIGLQELLADRRELSVEEYEAFARSADFVSSTLREPEGFCQFAGVRDDRRIYEHSSYVH